MALRTSSLAARLDGRMLATTPSAAAMTTTATRTPTGTANSLRPLLRRLASTGQARATPRTRPTAVPSRETMGDVDQDGAGQALGVAGGEGADQGVGEIALGRLDGQLVAHGELALVGGRHVPDPVGVGGGDRVVGDP